MALVTYRRNEQSLQAYNTLRPLVRRIKGTIRGWWMGMLYVYAVTFVLLYYSKDHASITAWVFIPHALITLFLYFKNNKRNGRMFSTLKEYVDVTRVDLLATPYRNLLNFTCLIIVLDAILGPVIWPVKFFFWIFYRIFRLKMRRVKRAILEGGLILIPEEDEIAADPFYNFLMREGLYSSEVDVDDSEEYETIYVEPEEAVEEPKEQQNVESTEAGK